MLGVWPPAAVSLCVNYLPAQTYRCAQPIDRSQGSARPPSGQRRRMMRWGIEVMSCQHSVTLRATLGRNPPPRARSGQLDGRKFSSAGANGTARRAGVANDLVKA
jgi:hypothetical protein